MEASVKQGILFGLGVAYAVAQTDVDEAQAELEHTTPDDRDYDARTLKKKQRYLELVEKRLESL